MAKGTVDWLTQPGVADETRTLVEIDRLPNRQEIAQIPN